MQRIIVDFPQFLSRKFIFYFLQQEITDVPFMSHMHMGVRSLKMPKICRVVKFTVISVN
jgi:hypothetical protein